MLFDFHSHDSPAAIWTILSVPVEWNEEPSGVHGRRGTFRWTAFFFSMLFDFHFHDSPAAIWTILPVPVEWNEVPSGVHGRRTRKEASGKRRFPRHPGSPENLHFAGTSKKRKLKWTNRQIYFVGALRIQVMRGWPGGMRGTPIRDRRGVSVLKGARAAR